MKILVFASLTPPATANYLISALRNAGHELFVCSDVLSPLVDLKARGAVDVASVCARQGLEPELVLFIEGGTMRLFPVGLEQMSCHTAWYGIDTHMDYAKHLRIGRLFDVTFVAQKEFVERLRQDGLRQAHWLPLAFAAELHPAEMLHRCYDVVYVGSSSAIVHPVRHAMLAAIRKEFPNVFMDTASPQDMGRIYAQAKLVFNKSVNNDVNMRYFEAMGAGAVLLTDPALNNGVDELFHVGEHYLEYRDELTVLALIRSLLQDPERCQRVSYAARLHVLAHHTYQHRAEQLLETMRQSHKLPRPRHEDYFPALISQRLLDEALRSVGRAVSSTSGSGYRRVAGQVANAVMIAFAEGISLIERLRGFIRRV
jgi:Glycosyl transferases group 1